MGLRQMGIGGAGMLPVWGRVIFPTLLTHEPLFPHQSWLSHDSLFPQKSQHELFGGPGQRA